MTLPRLRFEATASPTSVPPPGAFDVGAVITAHDDDLRESSVIALVNNIVTARRLVRALREYEERYSAMMAASDAGLDAAIAQGTSSPTP